MPFFIQVSGFKLLIYFKYSTDLISKHLNERLTQSGKSVKKFNQLFLPASFKPIFHARLLHQENLTDHFFKLLKIVSARLEFS